MVAKLSEIRIVGLVVAILSANLSPIVGQMVPPPPPPPSTYRDKDMEKHVNELPQPFSFMNTDLPTCIETLALLPLVNVLF